MYARRPPPLKPGARLALVATSGPMLMSRLDAALEPYLAAGFEIIRRRDLGRVDDAPSYLAGPDEVRLDELVWALTDPDIDAVLCVRGGYGSMRLLPALRRALRGLELPPKAIIGFSDITALHAFCHHSLGWAGLHAPLAFNFGPISPAKRRSAEQERSWGWLLEAMTQVGAPPAPCVSWPGASAATGRISGVVTGGNLAVLDAIYRSPALPTLDGAILVLEDVGEAPYRLDRMITSLWLRGAAEEVRAVALGRFTETAKLSEQAASAHVARLLEPWGVPVFTGLEVGHDHPQRALWFGRRGVLDPEEGVLYSDLEGP